MKCPLCSHANLQADMLHFLVCPDMRGKRSEVHTMIKDLFKWMARSFRSRCTNEPAVLDHVQFKASYRGPPLRQRADLNITTCSNVLLMIDFTVAYVPSLSNIYEREGDAALNSLKKKMEKYDNYAFGTGKDKARLYIAAIESHGNLGQGFRDLIRDIANDACDGNQMR